MVATVAVNSSTLHSNGSQRESQQEHKMTLTSVGATLEAEIVRVKVSIGGNFEQSSINGKWRYAGGDTFLETVPVSWRYADLVFSLAEKVNGAISVKYQLPGEDLDPDSLITISDDSDMVELFDEYFRALRQPGTPIKTFRLRLFLFRAAEEAYTPEDLAAEARYLELSPLPGSNHHTNSNNRNHNSSSSGFGEHAERRASAGGGTGGGSTGGMFSSQNNAVPPVDSDDASSIGAADGSLAHLRNGGGGGSSHRAPTDGLTDFEDDLFVDGIHTPSTVAADAELAWEAGFKAGQEAAMVVTATEEEWTDLLNRRMAQLAQTASEYLLGDGAGWEDEEDLLPHHQGEDGNYYYNDEGVQRGHQGGGGDGSPVASLAAPGFALHPRGLSGSSIDPDATDPEFKSMFESKYEITDSTRKAREQQQQQRRSGNSILPPAPAPSIDSLNLGGGGTITTTATTTNNSTLPPSGTHSPVSALPHGPHNGPTAAHRHRQLAANTVLLSPNSLLPAHISIFGDDVGDAAARAAVAEFGPPPAAAANLPSHISEFGGSDSNQCGGCGLGNCDGCDNGDDDDDDIPLPEGVAEAALPDEDSENAHGKQKRKKCHKHHCNGDGVHGGGGGGAHGMTAPDAALLPTQFSLLAGPSASNGQPRHQQGHQHNGLGADGATAGALPAAPANLPPSTYPLDSTSLSGVHRVDFNSLIVLAKIGEGSFGEVSLCQCPTFGRVAVKWIKSTKIERWQSFWREAELMSRLNHPNVLRFYGLVLQDDFVVGIMTEFAASGSLATFMRRGSDSTPGGEAKGFLPLRYRAQLALQAVNGMAYLHSQKVVHFDVKPDNLLVDGDWNSPGGPALKVADFGLSVVKANTFCSNVHDLRGTLPYMAPEMITDHQHVTEAADVWSLGVVFWEMLTLESPYAEVQPAVLIGALGSGNLRLNIPDWCEPEWRSLMESCWLAAEQRPTCQQLVKHLTRIRDTAPA